MAIKIKVLGNHSRVSSQDYERRPGYVFTDNPACDDYDWLVVYDELPGEDIGTYHDGYETLRCPQECTILATWEPVSIKSYSRAYTRQFGHLLSNRPWQAEKHPHYHLGRGYFHWFHGHTFEELAKIPAKTKLISAVCSAKQMKHSKHYARYKLVSEIAARIPSFDWFGRGVRPIGCKHEALDAYKYHVTVENHIGENHWTEKFADAILCECLPFYAGDPSLAKIFPSESFIPIPIDDPCASVKIIETAIKDGEYEKRRAAVLEAKRLILERYNFWDQVIEVIESAKEQKCSPRNASRQVRIYARKKLRLHSVAACVEDLWMHLRRFMSF